MSARNRLVIGLFVLVAPAACAVENTPSNDDGAAGAGTGGPECASDADCTAVDATKCTESGRCVYENACEIDADCRGDYKFCDLLGQCEPCRSDSDCPSETPVCVPGWEFGVWCAECRPGDSSHCPDGTWCTPIFTPQSGGSCQVSDCGQTPMGNACVACVNENATGCFGSAGECTSELSTLRACHVSEVPGWTPADCSTGIVPSVRGCTPPACVDEAEAVEACILGCNAATGMCP
jgi:hypothetical protein